MKNLMEQHKSLYPKKQNHGWWITCSTTRVFSRYSAAQQQGCSQGTVGNSLIDLGWPNQNVLTVRF